MKRKADTPCAFTTSDSWVILSPIERSIKRKIEAVGTPLKEWNVNIYRGVLTGCNGHPERDEGIFIISERQRDTILSWCKDEAERARTEQIIRPILRGRDIKRYGYEWAGLYLIATHNGIPEKGVKRIDIADYPAIKRHLDAHWDKISSRSDKGDTPYNLRSCAYMDDFSIASMFDVRDMAFSSLFHEHISHAFPTGDMPTRIDKLLVDLDSCAFFRLEFVHPASCPNATDYIKIGDEGARRARASF